MKYVCLICHGNLKYEEGGFTFDCNACNNGFVNFKQKIIIGDIHIGIWRDSKRRDNKKWYIEISTLSDNVHHYKLDIFSKSLKFAMNQAKKNINNYLKKYKQQQYNEFFQSINTNKKEITQKILDKGIFFDKEDIEHCFASGYTELAYLLLKYKLKNEPITFLNEYILLIEKLPSNLKRYFLIQSL